MPCGEEDAAVMDSGTVQAGRAGEAEQCGKTASLHKKYRPPLRVFGILGGGWWIYPPGINFDSTYPHQVKVPTILSDNRYFWWGMVDSNHRRHRQQIYSLSPLATREIPHMKLELVDGLEPPTC